MLTCEVDLGDFHALVQKTRETITREMDRAVEHAAVEGEIAAKASGNFRDRTGRLRANIVAYFLKNDGKSVTWELLSPEPYSRYVEGGTRAHRIYPKAAHGLIGPVRDGQTRRATGKGPHEHIVGRGIALRFQVGGVTVFAPYVDHPGTQPHVFMGLGYQQAERTLVRELEKLPAAVARIWQ